LLDREILIVAAKLDGKFIDLLKNDRSMRTLYVISAQGLRPL